MKQSNFRKNVIDLDRPPASAPPHRLSFTKIETSQKKPSIYSPFKEVRCLIQQADDRFNTFFVNRWSTKCKEWWPRELSEAGFYYRGKGLEVHCFSCKLKTDVSDWCLDPKESPGQAHARLSKDCKHVIENFYKMRSGIPENMKTLRQQINEIATKAKKRKVMVDISNRKQGTTFPDVNYSNSALGVKDNFKNQNLVENLSNKFQDGSLEEGKSEDASIGVDQTDSGYCESFTMGNQLTVMEYKYPQYENFFEREKTFARWEFGHKQAARILAEAGYFYTGENDVVRCFCCDLGLAEWDSNDDPWIEHARHSPKCIHLQRQKGNTYIDRIQMDWKKIYNPKHAAFDDKISRIATFNGWRTDIEQTPEILAAAGFFFTGEEDVVRCHYCDGGLRHWETGDNPWEEHAKWFPFCKYVIKMKGREYIDEVKSKREEAERFATIETQSVTESKYILHGGLMYISPYHGNALNVSILQLAVARENVVHQSVLEVLKELLFKDDAIRYAANQYYEQKGTRDFTAQELAELIYENESKRQLNNTATDTKDILETNRELKEKMKCLRCRSKDICMLFVNCGHRITCQSCSELMDYCPHCDKKITKRLKTFLS